MNQLGAVNALLGTIAMSGYSASEETRRYGAQTAQKTEGLASQYFDLYIRNPDAATKNLTRYLNRVAAANAENSNVIIKDVTPAQFGLMTNIVSLQYEQLSEPQQLRILRSTRKFLGRESRQYASFTAQLRNPGLLHDLVLHQNAMFWPSQWQYEEFLERMGSDWEGVEQNLLYHANNPLMFALTVPLATTDAGIRERFQRKYPNLTDQGIEIIAAHTLSLGAHHECLSEIMPGSEYGGWEMSMSATLSLYGEEYCRPIKESITSGRHRIMDPKLSFEGLTDKLGSTSFLLADNGAFVRFAA